MSSTTRSIFAYSSTLCCLGVLLLGCSSGELEDSPGGDAAQSETGVASSNPDKSEDQQPNPATAVTPQIDDEDFRFAAYEGNIETVRQALQAGMDVNSADSETKLTPLHMAAYNGHSRVVKLLLEHGAQVDARDHEGKTPLTHACTGPFQVTVSLLIEGGADINAAEATEGFTPLMMAAGLGEIEVVRILLQHKADPKIRDSDGDRAVDHAKNSGHTEIVQLLES